MLQFIEKSALAQLIAEQTGSRNYLLIDCREPHEFSSTELPHLPTALNIPLKSITSNFNDLTTTQFMSQYGHEKPSHKNRIIIYCRSGARAQKAAQEMIELGYENVLVYKGSANEWWGKV
ncbi:hypothetical protein C9374_006640 [Naegleria lovaniensis]|uniref:Rhodanese domain-containing protein n=1 Tax=Naegleria lovaniensis TaxID=51637 RepID=A0AA88GNE7_NAELO|nr:uncharacterized protein C9374_006640 [Naegleria lovaniensis]KAG2379523.1 hypothetical protein C9374_006640 [Naegleria lovaniensis]